mmetsp:Transcript_18550/g.39919  ORF Transcript_18550/g.39919 Transcript_18550/m.39919 type:complete len:96 (+) Transcript_18550:480-767(+)
MIIADKEPTAPLATLLDSELLLPFSWRRLSSSVGGTGRQLLPLQTLAAAFFPFAGWGLVHQSTRKFVTVRSNAAKIIPSPRAPQEVQKSLVVLPP